MACNDHPGWALDYEESDSAISIWVEFESWIGYGWVVPHHAAIDLYVPKKIGVALSLQSLFPGFAGTDPNHLFQISDKNLPVANLSGIGCLDDAFNGTFH